MTPEYLAEQAELANKWKKENEPLNQYVEFNSTVVLINFRAALEQVRTKLATMPAAERNTLLGRKPELKFLGFNHDQIMKKHVNDFKGVTTQNLDEQEARALYAAMPAFRKEQVRIYVLMQILTLPTGETTRVRRTT